MISHDKQYKYGKDDWYNKDDKNDKGDWIGKYYLKYKDDNLYRW